MGPLSFNHLSQEVGGVEIRTPVKLEVQHISTASQPSIPVMHISHLQDFEGSVGPETKRKIWAGFSYFDKPMAD
ncbi:hypothetical protein COP2_023580 [Malus domestica]